MVKMELNLDELENVTGGTNTAFKTVYCVNDDICIGCRACENSCAFGCISFNYDGHAKIAGSRCQGCGECEGNCPVQAIVKAF